MGTQRHREWVRWTLGTCNRGGRDEKSPVGYSVHYSRDGYSVHYSRDRYNVHYSRDGCTKSPDFTTTQFIHVTKNNWYP